MKITKTLTAAILTCITLISTLQAKEYYIDSQLKFDTINTTTLKPGDKVYLKNGLTFTGMLAPKGSGTKEEPILVSNYGTSKSKPIINAQGKNIAGVLLKDLTYFRINGLEITNTNGTQDDQGTLFGIYVLAQTKEQTYSGIYINNCYIHNVNGKVAGKRRGGIHVHMKKLKQSTFHDLRITNNRIINIGGVGIGNTSTCASVKFQGKKTITNNLWTKVYVARNFIDQTGRNNIIARTSINAIYEHNTLANSSRYDTGHSIFCFNTDGIKIQYNEAYGNVGNDSKDRGGYDADYNCDNTFIQYNYSHDNEWFCGIMKKPTRNVTIRYNISINDKKGIYFYGFDNKKQCQNVHIYNNTHFIAKHLKVNVFPEGRTPYDTLFENNIFYFEGKGKWGKKAKGIKTKFNNNLYHGIEPHPSDKSPITQDPKFTNPGDTPQHINWQTLKQLKGYLLTPQSPALHKAKIIKNNGNIDLFKSKITPKPHLGATGQ